ncbi:MAG TPA: DUF4416 family protein [Gemmataceae bacterium]|jgi:hypothetical protein|nr:DUF4416 family protein [Gemmataceae bacterium]
MALPGEPEPVKLFVAILWADAEALHLALRQMDELWGEIDFKGADHAFDITDYYQSEMGSTLFRRIVSFQQLVSPETLVEVKRACNRLEENLLGPTGRRVNLDSGYLDHNKIVLASAKGLGQKIYVGQGIYADLVARYRDGQYQPFEWTFPDFKDGRYDQELGEIRRMYLSARALRKGTK